jgi:hypothetical protein
MSVFAEWAPRYSAAGYWARPDLLPVMPSFMRRVCSGFAPRWGGLRTRSA